MRIYFTTLLFLVITRFLFGQCSFDGNQTNGGTLSPTSGYQTVSNVFNGQYFPVNVTCGNLYNFNFCTNGGSASWDTQITVLATDGTTNLAYNDDNCGLQSNVSYTANSNTTVYVLITAFYCNLDGSNTGATLAYNVTPVSYNPAFTLTATSCGSANATITGDTGGTFSFNPIPGDGAQINASTGQITNGTGGASYTVQYTLGCNTSSTQNVTLPSGGNPSFTLTASCGGATAAITGDNGGTFSFNPVPGDGAQINASTGQINNATAGNGYTVQYTVCGVSSTQSVTVLTDNCFNLNGNATYINVSGEQCIQLTAEVNNQTGCSWNTNTVDFSQGFSLTLDYYFGNNINGADGNTFTFQPSSSSACGQNGGQLGAGGLANALSIEFDTYDNDNPSHVYDMSCDHIAVEIDGNMQGPGAPYAGPVCAKSNGGNIDDGGTYQVMINWNPVTQTLDIYFDGNLRLSTSGDFVNTVFGGQSNVYWGATSATGGLNNQQYFCPSTVVVLPVELTTFGSDCSENNTHLYWETATEYRFDKFEIEYSEDGMLYHSLGDIDAVGNTLSAQYYEKTVESSAHPRLYRLKMIDDDGNYTYSSVIMGNQCITNESLFTNQYTLANQIYFEFATPVNYIIYNMSGQIIDQSSQATNSLQMESTSYASGIYYIQVSAPNIGTEARKIVLNN